MKDGIPAMKFLFLPAIVMGTAWAVRGQFGHEQGAAWAGAIGGMTIVLLARKESWRDSFLQAALAGAVGWGLGGMMSYGIIVGYGNGTDFVNIGYGLAMLFVVGGLYGFLGGGLFGVALEESEMQNPFEWIALATKMVAGAAIAYFFLIIQWEFFMTPPRSELWAACFGMAVVLFLIMRKQHLTRAIRIATYSGLGAGFGFAFGNFLQILGRHSGLDFNFWNVMEYSLGFFGGLGMAYGTYSSRWSGVVPQKERKSWPPLLALALFIPLIILKETFTTKKLTALYERLDFVNHTGLTQGVVLLIILLVTMAGLRITYRGQRLTSNSLRQFTLLYFAAYILLSWIITGALWSASRPEQYLYLINFAIAAFALTKWNKSSLETAYPRVRFTHLTLIAWLLILLCTGILLQINEPFEGMHRRF